ncbi:MAG: 3-dehydroquinate synthase [Verrucomicrobiota bacterium]
MKSIVHVRLTDAEYPIWIGEGVLSVFPEFLSQQSDWSKSAALIVDENVLLLHGAEVQSILEKAGWKVTVIPVPAGETTKNMNSLGPILSKMAQAKLDRRSQVIALGGGVVGDLAGFIASIYLRGIPFVQIPTTLLAMVDSSVGGKTGVNLPEGKNLVGAFYQPDLVVVDLHFLKTLPAREYAAGMAEVIKYGVIADRALFDSLLPAKESNRVAMIQRCIEIKAEIVAQDERETKGLRALLNFGHTLGHAVENVAGYGVLLHGEAVAIGMRAAAHLSQELAGMPSSEVIKIENTIQAYQLPLEAKGLSCDSIRTAMGTDKKVKAGKNRWVLSKKIGESYLTDDVPQESVERVMKLVLS